MATAAVAVSSNRSTSSNGFFQVPHSFAENQAALIPAERALALIILRRAENGKGNTDMNGTAKGISAETWERWTGLAPRQLDYAIKGLKEKGLVMSGRGSSATYRWDWNEWNRAIQNRERIVSPNTDPKRKEREAKAGQKVHEECHDHGCAMLRAGECPGDSAQSTAVTAKGPKSKTLVMPTPIPQYTAQTPELVAEKQWSSAFAAMLSFFPMVTVAFLVRLVAIARALFPNVTDAELAQAVNLAYRPGQTSAGLFLRTIPDALIALRRQKKIAAQSPPGGSNDELPHVLPGLEKEQKEFDDIVRILKATRGKGEHDNN